MTRARPTEIALRAALFVFELAAYRIDRKLVAYRSSRKRRR